MTILYETEVKLMLYIKLDENMELVITKNEPIYRGDHMNQKITYLIPVMVGDIDMLTATVYLSFIRADGTADVALLVREDEPYNERYYQYHLPITTTLSRFPGEVCTFLQIFAGSPRHPAVAKSGECILRVLDSRNMDEYITDRNLRLIYEMQRYMEDKVEKAETALNERIDQTNKNVDAKADNIVFNAEDSTIQLVSTVRTVNEETGEEETAIVPLGDPIFVRADTARGIANMEINADGDLIVTFEDEETQNMGRVVGRDGAVYVPHIDEHKVLTFTIDTNPGTEPPPPVDLDPNDEWGEIGDGGMDSPGVVTSYVWESM